MLTTHGPAQMRAHSRVRRSGDPHRNDLGQHRELGVEVCVALGSDVALGRALALRRALADLVDRVDGLHPRDDLGERRKVVVEDRAWGTPRRRDIREVPASIFEVWVEQAD